MAATKTQSEASYQDRPNGTERCSRCTMFRPLHGCTLVKGTIFAYGWCRFFEPAREQRAKAA